MTSEARIRANRENAKKSTGPRSRTGKARSSRNPMRHGMLATDVVLPDEDPEDFEALRNEWFAYKQPVGPEEEMLVETIVKSLWRLKRHLRLETAVLTHAQQKVICIALGATGQYATLGMEAVAQPLGSTDHVQALSKLGLALSLDDTGALIDKLLRYERSNELRYFEAIDRLLTLQSLRHEQEAQSNVIEADVS